MQSWLAEHCGVVGDEGIWPDARSERGTMGGQVYGLTKGMLMIIKTK